MIRKHLHLCGVVKFMESYSSGSIAITGVEGRAILRKLPKNIAIEDELGFMI